MRTVPVVFSISRPYTAGGVGIADHTRPLIAQGTITRLLDDAPPNNLPDPLTGFVGREGELDEVRGLLEGTRVLTLIGVGGAGKTRLALRAAADTVERFPDGVWWVELAALADGDLVGEQLLAAMGVRPLPAMLRSTGAACVWLRLGR